jgi:hypothetical protein
MQRFDFFTSTFFPNGLMVAGGLLLLFGSLIATVQIWIGLVLMVVGSVVLTTHYRFRINLNERVYRDYVWFMGLRIGAPKKFERVEYFFIKSGRESRTMNMRVASTTIHKQIYDGYLRFSEHDKVHIATRDNREGILRRLSPMSDALKIPIMDYTNSSS